MTPEVRSKLTLRGGRVQISAAEAVAIVTDIFIRTGCREDEAHAVAEHLVDTSLCGMESHGLMRTLQYAEQFQNGYLNPSAETRIITTQRGTQEVDGGGGIGIPAMRLAFQHGMTMARDSGISAVATVITGHRSPHTAAHAACCPPIPGVPAFQAVNAARWYSISRPRKLPAAGYTRRAAPAPCCRKTV